MLLRTPAATKTKDVTMQQDETQERHRTEIEHVRDLTDKIGAKLKLKNAILDLVTTAESDTENSSACKDLRDLLRELQRLPPTQLASVLSSKLSMSESLSSSKKHTLLQDMFTCSQQTCDQLFALQCSQLKLWDYEGMRERYANYLQTLRENQELKKNLKLFHKEDFLKHECLKSLHDQLELAREENKRLH